MTARLSKLFYERLGEQIANELVDWFNAVDATYRAELRELNEMHFARSDAKMEQRFAQQDAKIEQRFAQQDAKIERRFAQFEVRFAQFEAKMEQRFAQFEAKMEQRFAEFEAKIERRLGEQTRQMYLAWAVMLAAIAGLYAK